MALTRKRKAVEAFKILELLEDRVMRGKTWAWLKERAEKGMFQTVINLSLQDTPAGDHANEPGSAQRNFERN